MSEPILKLENLVAMAALYADLIDDIIQISILFFRHEGHFALGALRATLGQPLLYALLVENLLAVVALY